MLVTVLAMTVVVVPEVNAAASAGDLIKMDGLSSVYYLGADSKRYVFPNEQTYFSWYSDFSGVVTIPQSELETYPLGANVTVRPGTKLVKITTDPKVYAVEPNGTLKWVPDETTAVALYGATWAQKVVDVPDAFFTNYTVSATQVSATAYPTGSLVKFGGTADVFYINADGTASKVATEATFTANRFKWADIITSTLTLPTLGTEIATATQTDTSQGGGAGTGITAGAGTGLTVALASDTPASATYLRDTLVAQAVAPFLKLNFSASADGAVKVTNLKLTRSGISTDTDLGSIYLYDGNTQLAEYTSFSTKVVTFSDSAGLFTVPAGTTKSITVKADISVIAVPAIVSGLILSVNAASDITTDGAAVSGSFPVNGNQMAVATVTDMGYVVVKNYATFLATVDPGKTDEELWRFDVIANDQEMQIEKIKLTVVGTVSATDLANFKLEQGGTQIGSTVAAMNASKEVIFDLSAAPYKITSGQTKTIIVKADVVSGSARNFKFTIRKVSDFIVKDNGYEVYTAPVKDAGAGAVVFTLIEPTVLTGTAINSGSLTIAVAADSPNGNIPSAATGVTLAKFTYKATGEDIKVTTVKVSVNEEAADADIRNGKLYLNGVQVGITDPSVDDEATVLFTMTQVIPAGTTATFEYKADIIADKTKGTETIGTGLTAAQTVTVSLVAGTTDATGQASLASIATTAATGRTLTVQTGLLSLSKNTSFGNKLATNPTGTVSATGVKIASFTITAGAGEAIDISQIVLKDASNVSQMGDNFQNLILKNGTTQLGVTKGTLSVSGAATTYAFNVSPNIRVAAGTQYAVDVYADVLSGAADAGGQVLTPVILVDAISATGVITSSNAGLAAQALALQDAYIANNGTLTVKTDADTQLATQLVMGATAQAIAKFKFTADATEDIRITDITVSDNVSRAATGTLSNVKLYDGDTQVGSTVQTNTISATTTYANVNFSGLSLVIPKNTSKVITVVADITSADEGAVSASTHTLALLVNKQDPDTLDGVESVKATGVSSGQSITGADLVIGQAVETDQTASQMKVYKTKLTFSWDSNTPSGISSGNASQIIAKINVTNSANVAYQTATVKLMNFVISSTISNAAATNRNIKVYKDSVSGTPLRTTIWYAAANLKSLTTSMVDVGFADVEIAAGATKSFFVVYDTTNAIATNSLSIYVDNAATSAVWTDGITANITAADVSTLPLLPKTLTY